jgi:hypothetical protein
VDKEGSEQAETQERLQPVRLLGCALRVSTPMLSEGACTLHFRSTKNLQSEKACLQQMQKAAVL